MSLLNTVFAETYIPGEYQEQVFIKTNKCKVSMQILSTKSIADTNDILGCYGNFYITGNFKDSELQIYGSNRIGECIGGETIFPLYREDMLTPYYPKVGDTIYAIINTDSKYILKLGKAEYEKYSETPLCSTSNKIVKNDSVSNYFIFLLSAIIVIIIGVCICLLFKKKKQKK